MTRRLPVALAFLVLAVACETALERDPDVSVDPASRVGHVVFVVNASPLFYGLSVFRCHSDRALWTIGHEGGGTVTNPGHIVYGEVPDGFTAKGAAPPLTPGCYRVTVSGPSSSEFVVNEDGSVSFPSDTAGTEREKK